MPDKETLRELFDLYKQAAKTTPDEVNRLKEDIERKEADIKRRDALLRAHSSIHSGIGVLVKAAEAGDTDAADILADVAIEAAHFLYLVEMNHVQIFQEIARNKNHWPILATDVPGWEKKALSRITDLRLGANTQLFRVQLRKARGHDENLPARMWAKMAVTTIEQTRLRFLLYGKILGDFGSAESLADFCLQNSWSISEHPTWAAEACKLRAFSKDSHREWAMVIREIIREQVPDFHTHDDWKNQRNTAKASGRETRGVVQNRILNDISDALERLAPDNAQPVAGIDSPNSGK